MAALTDQERMEVARDVMAADTQGFATMRKGDLFAAVAAIDTAADAADNSLLATVASNFKAEATTAQKRMLKRMVLAKRYG